MRRTARTRATARTTASWPDRTGDERVWTYEQPYDAVAEIANHAAFYTDKVELTVTA